MHAMKIWLVFTSLNITEFSNIIVFDIQSKNKKKVTEWFTCVYAQAFNGSSIFLSFFLTKHLL